MTKMSEIQLVREQRRILNLWFGCVKVVLNIGAMDGLACLGSRKVEMLWEGGGESFWEGGDDFRVDGLHFHTCLTDILGFLERLEWWFEQDIDKEEVRFEGDEDGDEV
ncbi:hypothetical protein Tco_0065449 [Tanacetum coccineum]